MKRRGFLGSLLGLAAAKIAGVKVPEPVVEPPVVLPSVYAYPGPWTAATTYNGLTTLTVWPSGDGEQWYDLSRHQQGMTDVATGNTHTLTKTFTILRNRISG